MIQMKLTPAQTEELPFPIGCTVWYDFPEKASSDNNDAAKDPPILKQGVVESVSFDYSSKDMIYEVVYEDDDDDDRRKVIEEVSEHKLAFGANCPVIVDGNKDTSYDGMVLFCEPSSADPSEILYNVMIFMEGCEARPEVIDRKRIKYRKVKANESTAMMGAAAASQSAAISQKEQLPPTEKESIPASAIIVPSSITCDSVTKGSRSKEALDSSNKRARASDSASSLTGTPNKAPRTDTVLPKSSRSKEDLGSSNKRARASDSASSFTGTPNKAPRTDTVLPNTNAHNTSDSRKSIPSKSHESLHNLRENHGPPTWVDFSLPTWLQRDLESQKNLFYYLIGSKRHNRMGVNDIARELNCRVTINFNPNGGPADKVQPPMTITVDALSKKSHQRDLIVAREKIKDFLLGYMDIQLDGSKGRLVYDIAISCPGCHRPHGSVSGAVNVRNPFDDATNDNVRPKKCWMSVLDLPSEVARSTGRREFHSSYLMMSRTLTRIWEEGKCSIKICDDDFGVRTQYCDPFVLVMGKHWQGVDRAVEILKDAIRRHIDRCDCAFR